MRRIVTSTAVVAALTGFAGFASAKEYHLAPAAAYSWDTTETRGVVPNDSFTVYTGTATAGGSLTLLESTAVRDNVIVFDGVEEQINDYAATVPPALVGQRRFVTESTVNHGNGTRTDTIVVRAVAAGSDTPADLWPAGLANQAGAPLTSGGWALGIALPAALGGANPVNLEPGTVVLSATINIVSDGTPSGPLSIPLDFFSPSPSNWDGIIGISFTNGANDAAIDSQITFSVTTIPEPGSLALLGGLAPVLLRRRRI